MQISKDLVKAVFGKAALASAALGGLLFLAGAPAAKANDCAERIRKTEHQLHEAIEDHGYYSRQANHWRHERREAYERCERYGYGYRDREYRYNRDYRDRDNRDRY